MPAVHNLYFSCLYVYSATYCFSLFILRTLLLCWSVSYDNNNNNNNNSLKSYGPSP